MDARRVATGLLAGAALAGLSGCIDFEQPVTFDAGATEFESTLEVVVADVTGDGTADALVVTSAALVRVDICGDNCFVRRESFPFTGVHAVGDFDGDGITDVHTRTRLYFGGPATATRPAGLTLGDSVAIPAFAAPVADVGDLDGDGDLDLLSMRSIPGGVSLMYFASLNDGAGGFTQGPDIAPSTPVNQGFRAEVGDVDGDGCDDLFNYGFGSVTVHRCNGPDIVRPAAGPGPHSYALGDVDGDGLDDLAYVSGSAVAVLRSTGSSFEPLRPGPRITLPNPADTMLGLRDIDGDDVVDLQVDDRTTRPRWLSGNGDGTFRYNGLTHPPEATFVGDDAFGDVDGDGLPDVLLPDGRAPWGRVILYRNASSS